MALKGPDGKKRKRFVINRLTLAGPKDEIILWDRKTHEEGVAWSRKAARILQGLQSRAGTARGGKYKVSPERIRAAVTAERKRFPRSRRSDAAIYRVVGLRLGISSKTVRRHDS
jgi:hypothetical protein